MSRLKSLKPGSTKTEIINPNTGHRMQIDTDIYSLFSKAIVDVLKKQSGLTFTELTEGIRQYFSAQKTVFKKSVSWYAISVKYDLEARGIVETFKEKGKLLNRLK